MNRLQIKTKRDWCIAFIFAVLVVYMISKSFDFQGRLLRYGNPFLTNMNQPKSYGNAVFTILVMTIITELVLWKLKKSIGIKIVTAVLGIALGAAVMGGYFFQCNKIVSVKEEEEGKVTTIAPWGEEEDLSFTEEEKKEILKLCETLEPVSKEEQDRLEKEYLKTESGVSEEAEVITAWYPEKYGHNFELRVEVEGDRIFIWKGYDHKQRSIVTFFKDNGLTAYFRKES